MQIHPRERRPPPEIAFERLYQPWFFRHKRLEIIFVSCENIQIQPGLQQVFRREFRFFPVEYDRLIILVSGDEAAFRIRGELPGALCRRKPLRAVFDRSGPFQRQCQRRGSGSIFQRAVARRCGTVIGVRIGIRQPLSRLRVSGRLHPGADSSLRLLERQKVFQPPCGFIENIGNSVAALRNIELSIHKVLRLQEIDGCQIADNAQMIRPPVVVGGVMPAARGADRFPLIRRIRLDQLERLDFDTVAPAVEETAVRLFPPAIVIRVAGKPPPDDRPVAGRTFPGGERKLLGNAAPFVVEAAGMDVERLVNRLRSDGELHAPTDPRDADEVAPGRVPIRVIEFRDLFPGKRNFPLIPGIPAPHADRAAENRHAIFCANQFELFPLQMVQ